MGTLCTMDACKYAEEMVESEEEESIKTVVTQLPVIEGRVPPRKTIKKGFIGYSPAYKPPIGGTPPF